MTYDLTFIFVASAYNAVDTLDSFFDGLYNQTDNDWILVIADDCSTDNTYEVILKHSAQDNRIISSRNPINLGLTRSLISLIDSLPNDCIVVRLDVDETHSPLYLEALRTIYSSGADCVFVSQSNFNRTLFTYLYHFSRRIAILFLLLYGNIFQHGSSSYSKNLYDRSYGYSKYFTLSQDYHLWLRMLNSCSNPHFGSCQSLLLYRLPRQFPSLSSDKSFLQLLFSLISIEIIGSTFQENSFLKFLLLIFLLPLMILIRSIRYIVLRLNFKRNHLDNL